MKTELLTKEQFKQILRALSFNNEKEEDFLFDEYETIVDSIDNLSENVVGFEFNPVNHVSLIMYLVNEYRFALVHGQQEASEALFENDAFFTTIGSLVIDKYLTNEQLNFKDEAFLNKFNPAISTLELYLNFSLNRLNKIEIKSKEQKLIRDLLQKAFKMGKCICELLINGFETEAFSTWRTLHENECLLIILVKYGAPVIEKYFKHMTYNLAFRGQIGTKEETDAIFEELKGEMKEHDLKSKDMKKFIEYGYLYAISDLESFEKFKLNFRDGVESIAGLSNYAKLYEMASEIAHSSPLLFYSNRSYFFNITLLNLYESFFRLESIFDAYYKHESSKIDYENFLNLKTVYLTQLHIIYSQYIVKRLESFDKNR